MTQPNSVLRILLWRLGGVAVATVGVTFMALAVWTYTRGPQYGAGGTVFLLGLAAAWGGVKMIRKSAHDARL